MKFQSTLSLRRATSEDFYIDCSRAISIHALLAESDLRVGFKQQFLPSDFNPRSPCGERPARRRERKHDRNFNPRSPCGERRIVLRPRVTDPSISIHALLAESDVGERGGFNPLFGFQSTLSLRRATCQGLVHSPHVQDFNPRSPCGERRRGLWLHPHTYPFQSTLSLRRATACS